MEASPGKWSGPDERAMLWDSPSVSPSLALASRILFAFRSTPLESAAPGVLRPLFVTHPSTALQFRAELGAGSRTILTRSAALVEGQRSSPPLRLEPRLWSG